MSYDLSDLETFQRRPAYRYLCPGCGARPGEPCRRLRRLNGATGDPGPKNTPHAIRLASRRRA